MRLSTRWITESLRPKPIRAPGRFGSIAGRGVMPGGTRFVVVSIAQPWPPGAEVELLETLESKAQPGARGWVESTVGTGLVRVALGNGCDPRPCRWARMVEDV